jgi:hypothetical protein
MRIPIIGDAHLLLKPKQVSVPNFRKWVSVH